MPFSKTTDLHTEDYWTAHFNDYLTPLIESVGDLDARRSSALRGDVVGEIVRDMITSPIVVADLTDFNPNVLWELGVRQSFKHGTITIMEGPVRLPFDLSGKGTLAYYPGNHIKNAKFEKEFKNALLDILQNPNKPDSHVLQQVMGRGSLFEVFRLDEAKRRVQALIVELAWNRTLMRNIMKNVEENKKLRESKQESKVSMSTNRFEWSSVEHLNVNRYLDESDEFYDVARRYQRTLKSWDKAIDDWFHDLAVVTEEWFDEHQQSLVARIDKFEVELNRVTQRLAALV
jgi:hypothetical protein